MVLMLWREIKILLNKESFPVLILFIQKFINFNQIAEKKTLKA